MAEFVKEPDKDRQEKLCEMMTLYEKDILRFACVYLRDLALAEDAVQETFLKAYKGLLTFRGESSEKTWLMHIAVNTCKDMRKSAWYRFVDRRVTTDSLPEPVQPISESALDVTQGIMKLPHKQMEIVLLYYYQHMTLRETADTLGISPSAASRRLKGARDRLRTVLEKEALDNE